MLESLVELSQEEVERLLENGASIQYIGWSTEMGGTNTYLYQNGKDLFLDYDKTESIPLDFNIIQRLFETYPDKEKLRFNVIA